MENSPDMLKESTFTAPGLTQSVSFIKNSLDVSSPVTLSWQEISVFVKVPKGQLSRNLNPDSYQPRTLQCDGLDEVRNHFTDGDLDRVEFELLIGNGWNDCSKEQQKMKGNLEQRLNQEEKSTNDRTHSKTSTIIIEDLPPRLGDASRLPQCSNYSSGTEGGCRHQYRTENCSRNDKNNENGKNKNKNHSDDAKGREFNTLKNQPLSPSDNNTSELYKDDVNRNENYPSADKDSTTNSETDRNHSQDTETPAFSPIWQQNDNVLVTEEQVQVLYVPNIIKTPSSGEIGAGNANGDSMGVSGESEDFGLLHGPAMQAEPRRPNVLRWKSILRGVTGIAYPGTLLAVVGSSGSGKSTLMKVLSCRSIRGCYISGTIRVNGITIKQEIRRLSAFVANTYLFLGNLTVKETLVFRDGCQRIGESFVLQNISRELHRRVIPDRCLKAYASSVCADEAMLGLGSNTKDQRVKRVIDILTDTGLAKAADSLIGVPGTSKGISTGVAKRLMLACELVTNPSVIFCEEPASGVDMLMARSMMKVLETLARRGHTVICTIQQPSSHVLACFDKLLLLAEGRMAFMGTTSEALNFFNKIGKRCPVNFSPADFFLEVLGAHSGTDPYENVEARSVCQSYSDSMQAHSILFDIQDLVMCARGTNDTLTRLLHSKQCRQASWYQQFIVILWRTWTTHFRHRACMWAWLLGGLLQALLIGVIFHRMDLDSEGEAKYSQRNVINLNGAIFLLIVLTCYITTHNVTRSFPSTMAIMLRDTSSGLYRVDVFYLATLLAELPIHLFLPILFISIDYWMIGLYRDIWSFFKALGIVSLGASTSASFGYLVSSAVGDSFVAFTVSAALMFPLLILGGFIVNYRSLFPSLRCFKYFSWFRQTNELLVVNQWSQVDHIQCPTASAGCSFNRGLDVLEEFGFSAQTVSKSYLSMTILLALFHVSAYVCLLSRVRLSRG